MRSTLEKERNEIRIEKRETQSCHLASTKASIDLLRNTETGMTFQSCPELGKEEADLLYPMLINLWMSHVPGRNFHLQNGSYAVCREGRGPRALFLQHSQQL